MKGLHRAGCATFTQSEMISFVFFAQNDECLILKMHGSQNEKHDYYIQGAGNICECGCKNKIVFKIKKSFALKNYA